MNKQRLAAALELIPVLAERFPAAFAVDPRSRVPLKLGIHVDILAQLGETVAPQDLSLALRVYVGNWRYLKALRADAERVDLNGQPAGKVTAEHAEIAKARYQQQQAKWKAKRKPPPPPTLSPSLTSTPSPTLSSTPTPPSTPTPAPPPSLSTPRRISFADLRMAAQARKGALS